MKTTRFENLFLVAASALVAAVACAARDPFVPVDYVRPVPVTEAAAPAPEVAAPTLPQPPPPPAVKPVTQADWDQARKTLKISGVTKSVTPSTGVTVVQAMINRKPCCVGDVVTFVCEEVRYQWRVESIGSQDAVLAPLKAERLPPQNTDLKSNQ